MYIFLNSSSESLSKCLKNHTQKSSKNQSEFSSKNRKNQTRNQTPKFNIEDENLVYKCNYIKFFKIFQKDLQKVKSEKFKKNSTN